MENSRVIPLRSVFTNPDGPMEISRVIPLRSVITNPDGPMEISRVIPLLASRVPSVSDVGFAARSALRARF